MKLEANTQQEIFRMIRAKKNLTNQQIAEMVGVKRQLVNLYEKDGVTKLGRNHRAYNKLCEIYGLDPDELGKMIDKQKAEEKKAKSGSK